MTDLEIANKADKKDIIDVARELNLCEDDLILYGSDKAKIKCNIEGEYGDLILVTAISPTPYGEGKTTVSIGLNDALRKLGKNSVAVLRQPSMGPVFGMKGGATGGGYSQVIPMEDINLHFTGDFHAIAAANNLLCAAIDNHIYFGNELDIQEVMFDRCLDINDRALRRVNLENRVAHFSITAASEIMALFCLAEDIEDLKKRLGNIVIGKNSNNDFIYARDLKVEGAMTVILKEAFLPNLVQSLENNPVIIHGGPFANIAHGCNSVVATKSGLKLADYVVTEAGFGADLGAEKFFDIKCRQANIKPKTVVLVATIKALKYHGGVKKNEIYLKNHEALTKGLKNMVRHIENLKKFGVNVVVCLNKYDTDNNSEIKLVEECCLENGVLFSVSTAYVDGGDGAIDLALKVLASCSKEDNFHLLYDNELSIVDKIKKVVFDIYGATDVEFSDVAIKKVEDFENKNISYLPICVAKTQYSFTDDQNLVGAPDDFKIFIKDLKLYNGAGFITVLLGDIMTMPGLGKNSNYENINLIDGKVVGLF